MKLKDVRNNMQWLKKNSALRGEWRNLNGIGF